MSSEINPLDGYKEVSYENVVVGSHVKYVRKDGKLTKGGFVTNTFVKDGERSLYVANGFNKAAPGYYGWPVKMSNISKLFMKVTKSPIEKSLQDVNKKITDLVKNYNILIKHVKELSATVSKLT
jgi:hypothetical protein